LRGVFERIKSKVARWAVLRNKMEALRILVNDSEIYNIMAALRGPDTQNDDLKWIFTARLRYLVGMDCGGSGVRCRTKKEIRLWEVFEALKKVNEYDEHYLSHVELALFELMVKGLIDKEEYSLLRELADILQRAGVECITKHEAEDLIKKLAKKHRHLIKGVIK